MYKREEDFSTNLDNFLLKYSFQTNLNACEEVVVSVHLPNFSSKCIVQFFAKEQYYCVLEVEKSLEISYLSTDSKEQIL